MTEIKMITATTCEFNSPINIDNGYTNNYQGDYKSTMEWFSDNDGTGGTIEWIVNDGEFIETIGCFCEDNVLHGYDGVFELPAHAIAFLRELKITVPEEFE